MIRCNGNLSTICKPRLHFSGSTSASGQLPQHPVPALVAAPYREAPRDQHHCQTPSKPAQALTSLLDKRCTSYKTFAAPSLHTAPTQRLNMSVSLFSGFPCSGLRDMIFRIPLPLLALEVPVWSWEEESVCSSGRSFAFAENYF